MAWALSLACCLYQQFSYLFRRIHFFKRAGLVVQFLVSANNWDRFWEYAKERCQTERKKSIFIRAIEYNNKLCTMTRKQLKIHQQTNRNQNEPKKLKTVKNRRKRKYDQQQLGEWHTVLLAQRSDSLQHSCVANSLQMNRQLMIVTDNFRFYFASSAAWAHEHSSHLSGVYLLLWFGLVWCIVLLILFSCLMLYSNANNTDEMFAHSDGFIINAIFFSFLLLMLFFVNAIAGERSCGWCAVAL